ncbi:MAG: hypothetical protein ACK4Z6_06855 [Candidatus Methylomirabilales bacterium]
MKQVGVFLPKKAGVPLEEVKRFLTARGIIAPFEVDPSGEPDGLRNLIVRFGLEAAVLVEAGEEDRVMSAKPW